MYVELPFRGCVFTQCSAGLDIAGGQAPVCGAIIQMCQVDDTLSLRAKSAQTHKPVYMIGLNVKLDFRHVWCFFSRYHDVARAIYADRGSASDRDRGVEKRSGRF